jgi:hypothetical protein
MDAGEDPDRRRQVAVGRQWPVRMPVGAQDVRQQHRLPGVFSTLRMITNREAWRTPMAASRTL